MTESDWPPARRFLDLEKEIEEAFGRFIDRPWGRTPSPEWMPAVDIYETRDSYIVSIDLPGVQMSDVELHVRAHEIEICGSRTATRITASAARIHSERMVGTFCRVFPLEHPVDPQSAQGHYESGVYEVQVKKSSMEDER